MTKKCKQIPLNSKEEWERENYVLCPKKSKFAPSYHHKRYCEGCELNEVS